MARNTNTNETSNTSTTPKRKFGVNVKNIPDAMPTIPDGVYIGDITGASVMGKGDKSYINVVPETQWDKEAVNEKSGKTGSFVPTGDYIIQGDIYYRMTLKSEEQETPLPMDEMTIPMGRVKLFFNKEDYAFSEEVDSYGPVNRVFKQFIEASGLPLEVLDEINEAVSYTGEDEIEVPEELQNVPNIVEMLHYVNFYREYFSLVCEQINGRKVRTKIKEEKNYRDPSQMANVVDTGNYNSFSGILPLEEKTEG